MWIPLKVVDHLAYSDRRHAARFALNSESLAIDHPLDIDSAVGIAGSSPAVKSSGSLSILKV
jgi:hypothetical protein